MATILHHVQLITIMMIALWFNHSLSNTLSDFDILWHDSMDSSSWSGHNDYEFGTTSDQCPNTPDACARVSSNNEGNSYIIRNTDITGYDAFQLQIDVNLHEKDFREANYCQIWYQYDEEGWIKYSAYSARYTNLLINLPSTSAVSTVLGIQLEITGDSTNAQASCYWDNIILRAIKSSSTASSASSEVEGQSRTVLVVIWLLIIFLCFGICLGTAYIVWKRGYDNEDIRRWLQKRKKQKTKSNKLSERKAIAITVDDQSDLSNDDFDRSLLSSWLENEVKLPQYLDKFLKNGYDNLRTVKSITNHSQLKEIGITKLGHQMLIIEAIRKLDLSIYDDAMGNGHKNHNNTSNTDNIKVYVDEDEDDEDMKDMSSSSSSVPSVLRVNNTEIGKSADRALDALVAGGLHKPPSYDYDHEHTTTATTNAGSSLQAGGWNSRLARLPSFGVSLYSSEPYIEEEHEQKYGHRSDRKESDSMIYGNEWGATTTPGYTPGFAGGNTFFDAMFAVTVMGAEEDEDHFFGTPRYPPTRGGPPKHKKSRHERFEQAVSASASPMTKRARIEKELIDTEQTYLEGLRVLMYEFIEPIFEKKLIPNQYRKTITCNVPQLIRFHEQFLRELQSRPVSKVFNEQSAYFKMYISYIAEYENICDTIARFRKNKKLAAYLDKKTNDNKPLSNFLILPIQRTPRYMLLLGDLKKNTPATEEAYKEIERALKEVNAVCNEINEKKREIENMSQCLKISETLKGLEKNIVEPHRQFVDHFLFKRKKDGRNRQFFVFSDLVIIANPKWEVKSVIKLTKFFVKRANMKSKEIFINIVEDDVDRKKNYKGTTAYVGLVWKDIPKKHQHPNVSNLELFCDVLDKYRDQNAILFRKEDGDIKELLRGHEDEEELIHWEASTKKKGNKSKVLAMLGTPGGPK